MTRLSAIGLRRVVEVSDYWWRWVHRLASGR
jgi:hypothetical protein